MGSILAVKSSRLGKLKKGVRKHVTKRRKPVITIKLNKKRKKKKK